MLISSAVTDLYHIEICGIADFLFISISYFFNKGVYGSHVFTILTVQPPKPAPVIREPMTPVHLPGFFHQRVQLDAGYFVVIPQGNVGSVHQLSESVQCRRLSGLLLPGWCAGFRKPHDGHVSGGLGSLMASLTDSNSSTGQGSPRLGTSLTFWISARAVPRTLLLRSLYLESPSPRFLLQQAMTMLGIFQMDRCILDSLKSLVSRKMAMSFFAHGNGKLIHDATVDTIKVILGILSEQGQIRDWSEHHIQRNPASITPVTNFHGCRRGKSGTIRDISK